MEKKNNTIQVSDAALSAINGLQHPAGTYDYYRRTLDRLFNTVLHASEELGMDDMEAVATLRAIDSIRQDLATIAGPVARQVPGTTDGRRNRRACGRNIHRHRR